VGAEVRSPSLHVLPMRPTLRKVFVCGYVRKEKIYGTAVRIEVAPADITICLSRVTC
jgi:hypothetical protein